MKYKIITFEAIDSTNNYALTLAQEGIREGTVVLSDYQTKGRGRYRRRWVSPSGKNLLFSIILRPRLKAHQTPILTHLAGRVVKEALEKAVNVKCTLKQPNDVLINKKKVCGILTESHSRARDVEYVVVGVGINVNSRKKNLVRGATSLYVETGTCISRETLFHSLLKIFSKHYTNFIQNRRQL